MFFFFLCHFFSLQHHICAFRSGKNVSCNLTFYNMLSCDFEHVLVPEAWTAAKISILHLSLKHCFLLFLQSLSRWWLPSEENTEIYLNVACPPKITVFKNQKRNGYQMINKIPPKIIIWILQFALHYIQLLLRYLFSKHQQNNPERS